MKLLSYFKCLVFLVFLQPFALYADSTPKLKRMVQNHLPEILQQGSLLKEQVEFDESKLDEGSKEISDKQTLLSVLESIKKQPMAPDFYQKVQEVESRISEEPEVENQMEWTIYAKYAAMVAALYAAAYFSGYAPPPPTLMSYCFSTIKWLYRSGYELFKIVYSSLRFTYGAGVSQWNLWMTAPENLQEELVDAGVDRFSDLGPTFSEAASHVFKAAIELDIPEIIEGAKDLSEATAHASLDSVRDHEDAWGPFPQAIDAARFNTVIVGVATYTFHLMMKNKMRAY